MTNAALGILIAVVGVVVTGTGVFLGIPAWRLAKHAVAVQEAAQEQVHFNGRLMRALTGNPDERRGGDAHPPAIDLLYDIREMMAEHSELTMIVAHHVADEHGPPIPQVRKVRR